MIEIINDDGTLKEWVGYAFALGVVLIISFAVIGIIFGLNVLITVILYS